MRHLVCCWALAALPLASCAPGYGLAPAGAVVPLPAFGSDPEVIVSPGSRVRVMMPSAGIALETATVIGASGDSIVLMMRAPGRSGSGAGADSVRRALPLAGIGSLEVSRGLHENRAGGAIVGALVGFGAGWALGGSLPWRACQEAGQSQQCDNLPTRRLAYGGLGLLIGGAAGALIGSSIKSEGWERVPLDHLERVHIGLIPQPGGGLGVGASLTF
jgi:hypothetical protein